MPDGSSLYFGSASALAEGQTGDRYVKGLAQLQLDFTTGAASAQSFSTWSSLAVAGGNAQADLSLYLERTLSFSDYLSSADRREQILASVINNPPSVGQAGALALAAGSSVTATITEVDSGNYWTVYRQDDLARGMIYVDTVNGPVVIDQGDSAFTQVRTQSSINGIVTETALELNQSVSFDGSSLLGSYSFGGPVLLNLENVFLQAGMTYNLELSLSCFAGVSALQGFADPSLYRASCDADNSGYWLGLDNFRDDNGNPIGPISFASKDTGLDLGKPSPFAPDLGGVVPEPASWAMLIAGFGLVGGAMRRRRLVVA